MGSSEAWVTLATNDSYSLGALVLGTSLKRVGTTRDLVCMVTPNVSPSMRTALESVFNLVQEVNVLDSGDTVNLAVLTRPELGVTFTKFHCWKLTQYSKCVFLDADTLIIQGCDELFEREEFSAAPDSGWPDCFNSGVFVYRPSLETFEKLMAFAVEKGSFDGGDQGLLNSFFSDWATADIKKHLPFIYNMVSSAMYSYLPAYKVFGQNVKIAHFIGPNKPWLQFLDTSTGTVNPSPGQESIRELLQAWWDIFKTEVHAKLAPEMGREEPAATEMEQVQTLSFQSMDPFPSYSHFPPHFIHRDEPVDLDNLNVAIRRHTPEYLDNPLPPIRYETPPSQYLHCEPQHNRHQSPTEPPQHHHHQNVVPPAPDTHKDSSSEAPPPHHHHHHHESHAEPPPQQHHEYQEPPHHYHSDSYHQAQAHSEPHQHCVHDSNHQSVHSEVPSQQSHSHSEPHHSQAECHGTQQASQPVLEPYSPTPSISSDATQNPCISYPTIPSTTVPLHSSVTVAAVSSRHDTSVPSCEEPPIKTGTKGLAGVFAQMSLEGAKSTEQLEHESQMRKHAWEQGHIDFLGQDSFDNIFKKIQESMAEASRANREKTPEKPEKKKELSTPKPDDVATTAAVAPEVSTQQSLEQASRIATLDAQYEGRVPVDEPLVIRAQCPVGCTCHPQKPTAEAPPAELSLEDLEEQILATERAALEKKLIEQKGVAEQKLISEKAAAAQAALKKEEAAKAAAIQSSPATVPVTLPVSETAVAPAPAAKLVKTAPLGEAAPSPTPSETTAPSQAAELPVMPSATSESQPGAVAVAAAEMPEPVPQAPEPKPTQPAQQIQEAVKPQEPLLENKTESAPVIAPEGQQSKAEPAPATTDAKSEAASTATKAHAESAPTAKEVETTPAPLATEAKAKAASAATAPKPEAAPISTSAKSEAAPVATEAKSPETPKTKSEKAAKSPEAKPETPSKVPETAAPAPAAKPVAAAPVPEVTQSSEAKSSPPAEAAPTPTVPELPAKPVPPAPKAGANPEGAAAKAPEVPPKKEPAAPSAGAGKAQEPKAPPRKPTKGWSLPSLVTGIAVAGVSIGTFLFLRR